MAYDPKVDGLVVIGRPYKEALVKLVEHTGLKQRKQVERLIVQACAAQGIRVETKQ